MTDEKQYEYWTFERDGKLYDAEFTDRKSAFNTAFDDFVNECIDGENSREDQECDVYMVCMTFDSNGESVELERIADILKYEYEPSDYDEHNTYYYGGVL